MTEQKKLKPSFASAGTRKPIDHLDAWYGSMAHMLTDAVELLQHQPLLGEHALPAHVLAENIISSLHTFSMGGIDADAGKIKELAGFKKFMHICHEKDVHVDMSRSGDHMHLNLDPSQPFKTSKVLVKRIEPIPGQNPVLVR